MYTLGIDYGGKRVGVAIASDIAQLPHPYLTLKNDDGLLGRLDDIIQKESVSRVVVGLPRNMDGTIGVQGRLCKEFAALVAKELSVPVTMTEETLSSVEASEKYHDKKSLAAGLDAAAAACILERYYEELQR